MLDTTKRTIAALTAAACPGGGGWAIASAANSGASTVTTTAGSSGAAAVTPAGPPQGAPRQSDVTGGTAANIRAAVLAKMPGATVERVEKDPRATTPTSPGPTAPARPSVSTPGSRSPRWTRVARTDRAVIGDRVVSGRTRPRRPTKPPPR